MGVTPRDHIYGIDVIKSISSLLVQVVFWYSVAVKLQLVNQF